VTERDIMLWIYSTYFRADYPLSVGSLGDNGSFCLTGWPDQAGKGYFKAISGAVNNIDLSPCHEYVTDFA